MGRWAKNKWSGAGGAMPKGHWPHSPPLPAPEPIAHLPLPPSGEAKAPHPWQAEPPAGETHSSVFVISHVKYVVIF